jgi:putative ABC transport system permease protein
MDIQPILAALRKHKIPAALIVLEIALACAVLCNAVFMIGQRIGEINLPNAIDEQGVSDIRVMGTDPKLASDDVPRNLAALRQIPGVTAAAVINTMPLTNNGWNSNVATKPQNVMDKDNPNVATYLFTSGGKQALGLKLLRGRFFTAEEFADSKLGNSFAPGGHVILVTKSLAQRLWPAGDALGKQVWIGEEHRYTVIGIIADVLRMNQNGQGLAGFHWAIFFPLTPGPGGFLNDYIVRSAPQDRARVIDTAKQKLAALSPNAVVKGISFTDIRDKFLPTPAAWSGCWCWCAW